jgi:flavin reductase (DIM6/NTAB) family NADH-FMN oxidoreductase RutF
MSAAVGQAPVASDSATNAFSSRDLRNALGCFATGVTVITTSLDGHDYGMTANAFSSVSLDPPLVLICVVNGTEGCESITTNGIFAVNVLAAHQEPLSRFFSSKDRPRGAEGFADIAHRRVASGAPVLDECAAFMDCRVSAQHVAGDHTIFIGEVMAIDANPEAEPLLFHAGRYRSVATE